MPNELVQKRQSDKVSLMKKAHQNQVTPETLQEFSQIDSILEPAEKVEETAAAVQIEPQEGKDTQQSLGDVDNDTIKQDMYDKELSKDGDQEVSMNALGISVDERKDTGSPYNYRDPMTNKYVTKYDAAGLLQDKRRREELQLRRIHMLPSPLREEDRRPISVDLETLIKRKIIEPPRSKTNQRQRLHTIEDEGRAANLDKVIV